MTSHGEFDYASSGLLDDSYIPVARKSEPAPRRNEPAPSWSASARDVSPPSDDEARPSPSQQQLPFRGSRIFREQQDQIASQVVAHREKLLSAKVAQQRSPSSPAERQVPPASSYRDVSPDTIVPTRTVKTAPAPRINPGTTRIVLAVDYGTTYTGCAIARTDTGHATLKEIEVLRSWKSGNQDKVRTILSYAKSDTGETQWGEINDGSPAMVNTKLELEPQSSRKDELELTWYLLKGTGNLAFEHLKKIGPNPAYSSKEPREIVQDYLTHICQSALKPKAFQSVDLADAIQSNVPLDLIITVPAKWSQQATDATFKAIRGAGFNRTNFPNLNDTILISEPEAAAFFAIRDHQLTSKVDLRPEDCFIVCDAGGGTVDVVSFQVKQTQPYLELERATEPDSAKCGSAFVDTAFKSWLRDTLSVQEYGRLDPLNAHDRLSVHAVESGPMRTLIKEFILRKHQFSEDSSDMKLDLPAPLNKFDQEGRVRQGELVVYRDEMEEIFSDCVNGVIDLIDEQINKLKKRKNRRARDVFLVGGFGASPWLQSELKESCEEMRHSTLRRPEGNKSITAVVQGAVIYGIEKARHKDIKYMSAITDSYAVKIDGRFEWLVRRGDLVLSSEKRSIWSKYFAVPLRSCPNRKYEIPLYHYIKREEDDDNVPILWEDGQHEVEVVGTVKCDFNERLVREHQGSGQTSRDAMVGPLSCHLELSENTLTLEVLYKKTVLRGAHLEIKIQTDAQRGRGGQAEKDWRKDF